MDTMVIENADDVLFAVLSRGEISVNTMSDGYDRAGCDLTPDDARALAHWLLSAADEVEKT